MSRWFVLAGMTVLGLLACDQPSSHPVRDGGVPNYIDQSAAFSMQQQQAQLNFKEVVQGETTDVSTDGAEIEPEVF
jgi:hypothetical protein